MIVRITESCNMGCSHCLANSYPGGDHMNEYVWNKTLNFIMKTNMPLLYISGGEPTEHPHLIRFIRLAKEREMTILLLTNGQFLKNEALTEKILEQQISVQFSNDPKYYPKPLDEERLKKFLASNTEERTFVKRECQLLSPNGRVLNIDNPPTPWRKSPTCFNLRSLARHFENFEKALFTLRIDGKNCSPSINIDGSIRAGETPECKKIGTVDDPTSVLTSNLISMRCDVCGLESKVTPEQRKAIIND